jgi:hypothetical protein
VESRQCTNVAQMHEHRGAADQPADPWRMGTARRCESKCLLARARGYRSNAAEARAKFHEGHVAKQVGQKLAEYNTRFLKNWREAEDMGERGPIWVVPCTNERLRCTRPGLAYRPATHVTKHHMVRCGHVGSRGSDVRPCHVAEYVALNARGTASTSNWP